MTNQEIFDRVYVHLLTQNAKSEASIGCAYRGDNGRKCAIGCLIPDEVYKPDFEGISPEVLGEAPPIGPCQEAFFEALLSLGFSIKQGAFLNSLQLIHDVYDPCDWKSKLFDFADTHDLTVPTMAT